MAMDRTEAQSYMRDLRTRADLAKAARQLHTEMTRRYPRHESIERLKAVIAKAKADLSDPNA